MNVDQQILNPPTQTDLEFVSTLSTKGGLTLPLEVRRILKVKPKDKVKFRVRGEVVNVEPGPMSLEEAMGSVEPLQTGKDIEEIIKEAKEEHLEHRFTQKMQS